MKNINTNQNMTPVITTFKVIIMLNTEEWN